jgi:hypothetical protein
VKFKYEEKPSILERIRIKSLRKAVLEKQAEWMEDFRSYLRASRLHRDELEISRMLRVQMECFMQGRVLPDSVIKGLPKDTRRIYKKLNSCPPKPPPQNLEISNSEMKHLVCAELFKYSQPLTGSVKLLEKKRAAFVDEKRHENSC